MSQDAEEAKAVSSLGRNFARLTYQNIVRPSFATLLYRILRISLPLLNAAHFSDSLFAVSTPLDAMLCS